MSEAEPSTPGRYANPSTGGTRFWDGACFTGELLPASEGTPPSRALALPLGVIGLMALTASPFASQLNDGSVPTVGLFLGFFLTGALTLPLSVALYRGRARWIRSWSNRQASLRRQAEIAQQLKSQRRARRWNAVAQVLTAPTQAQTVSQLQTTRALRNLHDLHTAGAITDYEYQAQKRKLLG